jgi:hypothetical protein
MGDPRKLLEAASHALRSYQYGNASEELAEEMADCIDEALKEELPVIKPTVGRVVWYHPPFVPDSDLNEITLAAVIAKVWSDELVNLAVFDENGNAESRTSVVLFQGREGFRPTDAYCEWMPYQIGQAAKELHPVR